MKWFFSILVAFIVSGTEAQDVVFLNPENRIVMDNLDTALQVDHRTLNLSIGPKHKLPQNTIFFNWPFRFQNSTFKSFRIKGAFNQHMNISNCNFEAKNFEIDSTNFDTLFLESCKFKGSITFRNVYIKHFRFWRNEFYGQLSFIDCEIANCDLSGSYFQPFVSFKNCKLGNLDLTSSSFDSDVDLADNSFGGSIKFSGTNFREGLNLNMVKLGPEAKMSFTFTRLPSRLSLANNPELPDTIDLTKAKYNQEGEMTNIYLHGSEISKIKMDYSFFKLGFYPAMSNDEKQSIYQKLLLNFESYGFQDSYRKLDIEYKRFRNKQGTFGFLWWVPEIWWEYGYDKGRIFKITFWSILLFTIINFFLLNFLVSSVYSIQGIPIYFPRWDLNRLWFSFVYTGVIFFSLGLKTDRIRFSNKLGSLYLVVLYLYGIICLAYMANYILKQ